MRKTESIKVVKLREDRLNHTWTCEEIETIDRVIQKIKGNPQKGFSGYKWCSYLGEKVIVGSYYESDSLVIDLNCPHNWKASLKHRKKELKTI